MTQSYFHALISRNGQRTDHSQAGSKCYIGFFSPKRVAGVIMLCASLLAMPALAIETMNMFKALQSGTSTVAANTWANALCLANDSTDSGTTRDMLVVASFSQSSNGGPSVTSTVDYQLVLKDLNGSRFSNTQQRFLQGGSDEGNGMLAWIFTAVPGAATNTCDSAGTRFVLQHKRSTGTTTISTSNISLVAVPLDNAKISMDWWRAKQSASFSTSSSTFVPVTNMSGAVTIDNINGPRGAYVVATFSTELATGTTSNTGEWTLQGSTDNSTWNNIGSQVERSMSSTGRPGIAQLTALVEGIDAGSYYFRLASRRSAGTTSAIITKAGHIAAVSLVFDDQNGSGDGYFPWFNDTLVSPDCDYKSDNALDRMYGAVGEDCTSGNEDPLTDTFTMDAASDVFMTFVIGAGFPSGDSGDGVGTFESQIWNGAYSSGSEVFGDNSNGASQEVQRDFSGLGAKGAMGQVALWDTSDSNNAAGTYYAYGGWAVNGNALNTEDATIVGWVGRSVSASRAFITNFDAVEHSGLVSVEWKTVAERGTVGYRLHRLDEPRGEWLEVSNGLVPGMLDATRGGTYSVVDTEAEVGRSYTYLLEEEDVNSGPRRYGPYTLEVKPGGNAATAHTSATRGNYSRKARSIKLQSANRGPSIQVAVNENPVLNSFEDTRFRILVDKPGMQYVSASQLADMTRDSQKSIEKLIKDKKVRLYHHGEDVAWLPAKKNTGLIFYAKGLDTPEANQDVFWLEAGKGELMRSVKQDIPKAGQIPGVFTDTIRLEANEFAAPGWVLDAEHDFWFWQPMIGGVSDFDTASLLIDAPGAQDDGGSASLKAFFYGLSETSVGSDHLLVMSIDGVDVAESAWDGVGPQSASLVFPQQGNIFDGENSIDLSALLPTGVSRSWAYLDAIELTYSRRYEALHDALLLRGDQNEKVTAIGFGSKDILVFDVTDPDKPKRLKSVKIDKLGKEYAITFKPTDQDTPYMVSTEAGFQQPAITTRGFDPLLYHESLAAEYLVIAPADLLSAAQSLVDYRANQGLSGMAIDVQHIYDDFKGGVVGAGAIRDFLLYAYQNWRVAPRYVTIMGRGTQDRLNILQLDDNLVPTQWVRTPGGLAPTDSGFADLLPNDSGAWEIAVSRLPVVNLEEANAVVAKLKAYESGVPSQRVLLSADKPDKVADFISFSENLAGGFDELSYTIDRVYLDEDPVSTSHHQDLINQLQKGPLLWHWVGHGAQNLIANNALFKKSDVNLLSNGGALPVFASSTCLVNQFDYPGDRGLGEELVIYPDGGVLASFSPAFASITGQGMILSSKFRDAFMDPVIGRVGDAAIAASKSYAEFGSLDYVAGGYVLLGDAASTINK